MRWVVLIFILGCGEEEGSASGFCKVDVQSEVTVEEGGQAAAACNPDAPYALVESDVKLSYGDFSDSDRTVAVRLVFGGPMGESPWIADLHLPHDLPHGTWTVGGEGGPFLKVAEGAPLLTGQLTFSRSRDVPDFDQRETAARAYAVFVTVELRGLKWLQGGTQCGEEEVLVEDLVLRLEERGQIAACDG